VVQVAQLAGLVIAEVQVHGAADGADEGLGHADGRQVRDRHGLLVAPAGGELRGGLLDARLVDAGGERGGGERRGRGEHEVAHAADRCNAQTRGPAAGYRWVIARCCGTRRRKSRRGRAIAPPEAVA
jgi:hypothetical protein